MIVDPTGGVLVNKYAAQPDVLIDEKTGVVLVFTADVLDDNEISVVCGKVVSVAMKCSSVHVFLCRAASSKTSVNMQNVLGKLVAQVRVKKSYKIIID